MNQPVSFESPRVQFRTALPGLRALRHIFLGMAAFIVLGIGVSMGDLAAIPAFALAAFLWLAGPALALIQPLLHRLFPPKPRLLQVWNGALIVRLGSSQKMVPGSDVVEARLHPLERRVDLRLASGKGVQIDIPAFEWAAYLLDALGVAPHKRVYVARLGPDPAKGMTPWVLSIGVSLALSVAIAAMAGSALFAVFFYPFVMTVLFHIARALEDPGEVAVSREGITLGRLQSRQFLHHAGLREARVEPHRLRLFTDNGREITAKIMGIDTAGRDAIESWLQVGRHQFAVAAAGTDAFSSLDRRGRSIEAWREALRTILQQEGQYRRAPITVDDLGQLLTNPHAPAERRIAAAFVLSQNQTVSTHKQIRFAAESSSSQPMRIALRALADERLEADAIEEALAAETGALAR
jgi:hypothetical protein